jgi:glycosyltransferase involved in cell wall biosynthesis
MLISVIIPTHNRSSLLSAAIDSVVGQDFSELEVIVVDDASNAEHQPRNAHLAQQAGERVRYMLLPPRSSGASNGLTAARNAGVRAARGEVVGFLDDDDHWVEAGLLPTAARMFSEHNDLDLMFGDQQTWFQGTCKQAHYQPQVRACLPGRASPGPDVYWLSKADALTPDLWMAHMNVCMFRRDFYTAFGGANERLSYGEDRDIYIRAVDAARRIAYFDRVVSIHNRADRSKGASLSSLPKIEQTTTALGIANELMRLCKTEEARNFARYWAASDARDLAAAILPVQGLPRAAMWARVALGYRPTFKWAVYTTWLSLRALFSNPRAQG